MELTPDSKLVQNLLRKRALLREGGRHQEIRPIIVVLGGAMRGVSGAGTLAGLLALDLFDCFDVAIGCSTGTAILSYALCGYHRALLGASIYYEECCEEKFIDLRRVPIADIDFIEAIFRTGGRRKKHLDVDAIARSRQDFFVCVTDAETGEGALINAKTAKPDMISALTASLAMPGRLYGRTREVNGRTFLDGSIGLPLPVREIAARFQPTDMLVVANCSRDEAMRKRTSLVERAAMTILMKGAPPHIRRAIASRRARLHESWRHLARLPGVNVGVIWGSGNIGRFTMNSKRLRQAAVSAAEKIVAIFGEPHRRVELL